MFQSEVDDNTSGTALARGARPETSGLDSVSDAKCEDVTSVSDRRHIARLGTVDDEARFEMSRTLRVLLDFLTRAREMAA
jgi:hypothetical protein